MNNAKETSPDGTKPGASAGTREDYQLLYFAYLLNRIKFGLGRFYNRFKRAEVPGQILRGLHTDMANTKARDEPPKRTGFAFLD